MKYFPYFLTFFLGILFMSIVWISVSQKEEQSDFIETFDFSNIYFAGEPALIDGTHIFNRYKLERDLSVNRYNLSQFILYHKRESLYFPYIEEKLRLYNMPDDLKYISIAESGLRNEAVSSAGAGGIWQFMPATAQEYGLRVDEDIDERYDFPKATDAALQYLKKLHGIFGEWTLATAAYNRGENGLRRDIESQSPATSYYDLYLNPETGRYIYRILAIKYLMQDRYSYFSEQDLGLRFEVPKTISLSVKGPINDLQIWSREQGHSYNAIKELNPWIVGNKLPDGEWTLSLFP